MKNQNITSIYQSEINFLALFYMLYCKLIKLLNYERLRKTHRQIKENRFVRI